VSTPYGGAISKALPARVISRGAGSEIGKRFSTDPLRGNSRMPFP
jgi:hypothetical protein